MRSCCLVVALLVCAGFRSSANEEEPVFAIPQYAVYGGGGTSSGGGFAISGAIGEISAREMIGGTFTLRSGLGVIHLLQTPDTPPLRIRIAGPDTVEVFWEAGDEAWLLEETPSLITPDWRESTVHTHGSHTVPAIGRERCFRLRRR